MNRQTETDGPASSRPSAPGPSTVGEYLTIAQVAELLQCSTRHVARLVATDPTMPALKLGRLVRFRRDALERWLRANEQGQPRTRSPLRAVRNQASPQEPHGA